MKHLTLTTLLVALVLAIMPAFASAQQGAVSFHPTILAPVHTSTSIKASWKFEMYAPSQLESVPVYVWIGPMNESMHGSGTKWRKYYLGSVGTTGALPIPFERTFTYADEGIVAGKTYGYVLANGVSQSAVLMGDGVSWPEAKLFWCFTTAKASVPCPAQGQPDPAANEVGPLQLALESIVASDSLLKTTIKGTLKSYAGTISDVEFKILYRQKNTANLSQETLYEGNVSPLGVSFQSDLEDLVASADYDYYFVNATDNKTYDGGTFSMATTGNQVVFSGPEVPPPSNPSSPSSPNTPSSPGSGNGTATGDLSGGNNGVAVKGECGPAGSGGAVTVITPTSANLCSKGTVANFVGTGPWSWTCKGINNGGDVSCSATQTEDEDYGDTYLKNPLAPGLDTFPKIFAAVFNNIILPIAGPFLAIMYIYSGYLFVTARKSGSTGDLESAKKTFKYTTYGAVIILASMVIANAIQGTISEIISGTSV